jgi:RNA polymerase sigma factor (sigma-70 family)
MQPPHFQELIRQAQTGDRAAMDRVLSLLRPHLEQLARRYADPARASASASDLVQETELRVWQKLDQFRGGEDDEQTLALFRGWVGQTMQRLGLNARRDRKTRRRAPSQPIVRLDAPKPGTSADKDGLDLAGREPTPSGDLRTAEQARLVQAALAKVPDEADRTLLQLRFFEGLSLREAARRVGISYDKARDRFRVCMRHLEEELGRLR